MFHCAHLTKAKLAKIYNTSDDSCPRYNQSPATTSHFFLSCSALCGFWGGIFKAFSHVCKRNMDPDPFIAIFGVLLNRDHVTSHQSNVVAFASLLARRLILLKWKDARPPSFIRWVRDVMRCLQMEKLRYSLLGSPFLEYVETISFTG